MESLGLIISGKEWDEDDERDVDRGFLLGTPRQETKRKRGTADACLVAGAGPLSRTGIIGDAHST